MEIYKPNSYINIKHDYSEKLVVTAQFLDKFQKPVEIDLSVLRIIVSFNTTAGDLLLTDELKDLEFINIVDNMLGLVQFIFTKDQVKKYLPVGTNVCLSIKLVDSIDDIINKVQVNIDIIGNC